MKKLNIHLITQLSGFPFDGAAASRITMIGKALDEVGCSFNVYTCNAIVNKFNTESSGFYENIRFVYLYGSINQNNSKIIRVFLTLKGLMKLIPIMNKMKPDNDVVYIYANLNVYNIIIMVLCKINHLKIVQEINEWYPDELKNKIEKKIIGGSILRWSDGAIVISKFIYNKVLLFNPRIKTLLLPVLADSLINSKINQICVDKKYFFWMGQVDGYIQDVLFIINAIGEVNKRSLITNFYICGDYSLNSEKIIKEEIKNLGLKDDQIRLLGYISESDLNQYINGAFGFIIPLWNNDRSKARFPTKIAFFMSAGKPIITCQIGEPGLLLKDFENVLFYNPGDIIDLSNKIELLLKDKKLYNLLSGNSVKFANEVFNYKVYSSKLKSFFYEVIKKER